MLKWILDSLEGLEEAQAALYKPNDDGKFVLQVEGNPYKEKLSEFRDNNTTLQKRQQELEQQLSQFKGLDAEAAREALEAQRKMQDKKLLDEGKVDELLEQRTQTMREDFQAQLEASNKARDDALKINSSYQNELGRLKIDTAVQAAVQKAGTVRKGAMEDILNRARTQWKIDEKGHLKGENLFDDKGDPMTMESYAQRLVQTAPYFFEGAEGSDSRGNDEGGGGSKKTVPNTAEGIGANLEAIAKGEVQVSD